MSLEYGKKKGQAAIEYLMNYGWAILIMVVVLALLYFLITPATGQASCTTQVGFICNDPLPNVVSTVAGTTMDIRLHNDQASPITISKVLCSTSNVNTSKATANAQTIAGGTYADFKDVSCYDGGATLNLTKRGQFKGYMTFWYASTIDPTKNMTVTASVVAIAN